MKVGFIGLGRMGGGMAANLLREGHEVTVYNRSPAKAAALAARGARVAATPADASGGDAVMTMLADDQAVEEVVFGDGGVIESLAPDAIHISSSTISVDLADRLTQAHRELESRFISAPVFGRPDAAAAAKLFIVAAGDPAAVQACQPLFDAIGQKTFSIGTEPSAASAPAPVFLPAPAVGEPTRVPWSSPKPLRSPRS